MMALFPQRKPYQSGYLQVTDGHRLWYALYGNPKGIPVVFLHGGPGGGTSPNAHRSFNPRKFNIITFDQRGAGKSLPFASIKANTTPKLVQDIRTLLRFLKVDRVYLYGRSWGSSLALCYAIRHPDTVKGMVLQGIWLCTQEENDYMLKGGWRTHFPEVWERFTRHTPRKHWENPAPYYWRKMNARDPRVRRHYRREWALYEHSICFLEYDLKRFLKSTRGRWTQSLAELEAWYIRHHCFIPEGHILRHVKRIRGIPLSIVQGRYDFVCPPQYAFQLHKALPQSKLSFVTAGHAATEPAIREGMMREIHRMARRR